MGETEEVKKDSALNDQTSDDKKGSTSTKPQTYTEETQKKAISDALAEQGRVHKAELEPIKQELGTAKTQAEQAKRESQEATETLKESKQHVSNLESDIETLEQNDDDPNKLLRLRRELRDAKTSVRQEVSDERKALQTEKDTLAELKKTTEAERLEWAGTVAEAQAFKFDGDLARLVDEYDGDTTANFNKLKNACDKAGIKTKEGAEAIAELSFTKKTEEPNLLDDSGVTTGGGSSDKAFIEKLGAGGGPLTKEDMVRAKRLGIIR